MGQTNADFQSTDFSPRHYLDEYYTHIGSENDTLLAFFAQTYGAMAADSYDMLEIGGGPTVYQLVSAARPARSIVFTDYLEANLEEVGAYVRNEPAFDWQPFVNRCLEHELPATTITEAMVAEREALIRRKLGSLVVCNIMEQTARPDQQYDIVSTNFVAESITSCQTDWLRAFGNMLTFVKAGGSLVMTGLFKATYWQAGPKTFKACYIDQQILEDSFEQFGLEPQSLEIIDAEQPDSQHEDYKGFAGVFLLHAKKYNSQKI